jgi:hypothetical protein
MKKLFTVFTLAFIALTCGQSTATPNTAKKIVTPKCIVIYYKKSPILVLDFSKQLTASPVENFYKIDKVDLVKSANSVKIKFSSKFAKSSELNFDNFIGKLSQNSKKIGYSSSKCPNPKILVSRLFILTGVIESTYQRILGSIELYKYIGVLSKPETGDEVFYTSVKEKIYTKVVWLQDDNKKDEEVFESINITHPNIRMRVVSGPSLFFIPIDELLVQPKLHYNQGNLFLDMY